MSAKKNRPAIGAQIQDDMSHRDIAAAIGVSKTELGRWTSLARMPEAEFEQAIELHWARGTPITTASVLAMSSPVPARGRVQRALAIFKSMTASERHRFYRLALAEFDDRDQPCIGADR